MKMKIVSALAIVLFIVLVSTASCTPSTTTSTTISQTSTSSPSLTTTGTPVSTTIALPEQTKTKTTSSTVPTSSKETHWWDKWGEPQYGGKITIPFNSPGAPKFDNYSFIGANYQWWLETPWSPIDPTMDRSIWSYRIGFTPEKYITGNLLEKWEITDAQTIIGHVRKGIKWQNKPPVNGREFTAYDMQAHYDRLMGTGGGFTEPAPMYIGMSPPYFEKATATDKYTVVFKFSRPTGSGLIGLVDPFAFNTIEAPEWVAQGDLENWKNAVGTGPWILTNYVEGSSMTFKRNPEYWGHDQRYPENQPPYADELSVLMIPDVPTKLAALRTGKIDVFDGVSWEQAKSLSQTNPELKQATVSSGATAVGLRNDKAPFNDIRVRKALQLALDLKSIASGYFGGTVDGTPCWINPGLKGYAYEYKDWPQELKDEYSHNLTKARQLLTEAGYPNGFKTNIVTSGMYDVGLLQIIKAQFLDIGVDMEIKMMDQGTFRSYVNAGKHDQMVAWNSAMVQASMPPILARFDSTNLSLNWCHVNDPGYDAIVAQFNKATDPDEVARLMRESDKRVLEQHYIISTFATVTYNIWQPYLCGYEGEAWLGWGGTFTTARIWIDQQAKKAMGR